MKTMYVVTYSTSGFSDHVCAVSEKAHHGESLLFAGATLDAVLDMLEKQLVWTNPSEYRIYRCDPFPERIVTVGRWQWTHSTSCGTHTQTYSRISDTLVAVREWASKEGKE